MSDSTAAEALQEIVNRQRVWEVLLKYTRGVDRLDRALMLSAFHEDALIDQGTFKGDRDQLADWVLGYHRDHQLLTQHLMTNHFCEIDADAAHTETYVAYYGTNPGGDNDAFAIGRYIDRLECRSGQWGIVDRVCTTEGTTEFPKNGLLDQFKPQAESLATPTRDRSDPSYLRPLKIARQ